MSLAFVGVHGPILFRGGAKRRRWTCTLKEGERVAKLRSRVVVRSGEAWIKLAERIVDGDGEQGEEKYLAGRLRRELKGLKKMCGEKEGDEDAWRVVGQMEEMVGKVERELDRKRNEVDGRLHEEIEDGLLWGKEGGEDIIEYTGAEGGGGLGRKVKEKGEEMKRRATSVGEGIGQSVKEFIKDDGSVDVEGVKKVVGEVLDNAGRTWRRLNGYTESDTDEGVLVVRDTDKEFKLREQIGTLEGELRTASKRREESLRREDQLGKLMRAKEIRMMDDEVSGLRRTLAVRVLELEMEKMFVSLANEIEKSEAQMMREERVLVVEFGDLDERLGSLKILVEQEEPMLIEDVVVGELAADVLDLKTRLGLDEALYSSRGMSWMQLQQTWTASVRKAKMGVEFYWRGMRLFAGDLRFAVRLIRKTVSGYTPTSREVRTLRRTGRDMLTLVPFTIVLIAPLTPVGHVLIFSFLQRFWPEFFPSTFSERRQEVMKRHEQYAETLDEDEREDGEEEGERGLGLWRKRVMFGVWAKEATEEKEQRDGGEVKVEKEDQDGLRLSELAEDAMDSEKAAKKKRIAVAMDELHLAD